MMLLTAGGRPKLHFLIAGALLTSMTPTAGMTNTGQASSNSDGAQDVCKSVPLVGIDRPKVDVTYSNGQQARALYSVSVQWPRKQVGDIWNITSIGPGGQLANGSFFRIDAEFAGSPLLKTIDVLCLTRDLIPPGLFADYVTAYRQSDILFVSAAKFGDRVFALYRTPQHTTLLMIFVGEGDPVKLAEIEVEADFISILPAIHGPTFAVELFSYSEEDETLAWDRILVAVP